MSINLFKKPSFFVYSVTYRRNASATPWSVLLVVTKSAFALTNSGAFSIATPIPAEAIHWQVVKIIADR